MPIQNMEPLAATAAMRMIEHAGGSAETLTRRAALVLAEQGLFALGLFLVTRKRAEDSRAARSVHEAIHALLDKLDLAPELALDVEPDRVSAQYYQALVKSQSGESDADALYRILLTQRVLDRALSYAIFYAKTQ